MPPTPTTRTHSPPSYHDPRNAAARAAQHGLTAVCLDAAELADAARAGRVVCVWRNRRGVLEQVPRRGPGDAA